MYIAVGLKERSDRGKKIREIISHNDRTSERNRKPYVASKWCREMVNQAKRDGEKSGGYKPSGRFIDELKKRGGGGSIPEHAKKELRENGYKV